MARLANISAAENEGDGQENTPSVGRAAESIELNSLSPSPAASFSSDKENRAKIGNSSRQDKSSSQPMAPPQLPTPDQYTPRSSKRRRLGERDAPNASQTVHEKELAKVGNLQHYDPDQSMEERRAVRKTFRDLSRELADSRAEYLAPGSDGLKKTVERANELYVSVKQTSDAILDSRLLVSTSDLSAKRTTQLNLGDSTTGIDIDDFVGRCINFMRRGPTDGESSTQRRRRGDDSDEEAMEGFDEGDAFNWEWLGRQACFPTNVRPPVPGFLLGPLSVQKRARKATQRRERLQKRDPKDAIRPEELKVQDLEKSENSNLTTICKKIRELLVDTMQYGQGMVSQEFDDDSPEEEIRAALVRYGLADDGGVPFFNFVVNPKSFGQTVENLFYVSFLIRDGAAGLGSDYSMLPTLHAAEARKPQEIQEEGIQKHQAVFHLDFETWEDLIETFELDDCIIPHRQTDQNAQISASGWYG